MAKSRKTKLLKKEKYIKLAQSKALKLLKKNKTFKLTSFVIVEKFSKKDFISNSEQYLNSIGIAIYIWVKSEHTIHNFQTTYASASTTDNLESQIEIYGLNVLVEFYETMISNPKLKDLPLNQYSVKTIGKAAYLGNDGHHNRYSANAMRNSYIENREFQIYCVKHNIAKKAGYLTIQNPF